MATLINFTANPIPVKKDNVTNLTVAPDGRTPMVVETVGAPVSVDIAGVSYTFTPKSEAQVVLMKSNQLTAFPGAVQDVYCVVDKAVAMLLCRTDIVYADNDGATTLFFSGK